MNTKRLDQLGLKPLKDELALVDSVDSRTRMSQVAARFQLITASSPLFGIGVQPDSKQNDVYVLYVVSGNTSLRRHEYLLKQMKPIRDLYLDYMATILEQAGDKPKVARARAKRVLAMETTLAAGTNSPTEATNPENSYHKMSLAEFQALIPAVDLAAYFKTLGVASPPKRVIVEDPGALKALQKFLGKRNMEDIRLLCRAYLLHKSAPSLGSAFNKPLQEFYRKKAGLEKSAPREEDVVTEIHFRLGQPLSRLYLKAYYSEATRKGVREMAGHIQKAFRVRLAANTWLTDATRAKALRKLDRVKIMVGHPDKPSDWIDYSKLKITPDDYLGNAQRATEFEIRRNLAVIGKTVVREPFSIPFATLPIAINAAMHQLEITVYVTAAITQPPVFDPKRDVATNFGGLGAILGHELTHGFDSKGRMYDPFGNLRTWWSDKDSAEFMKRARLVIAQAGAYKVMPGLKLNGRLTLAENMADLGGVAIAYDALQAYMKKHGRLKSINGLTPEQRFFISWAQVWMTKARPAEMRKRVATDVHADAKYRAFGPLVNMPEFHKAFGIRPGDKMWKAPKNRIRIW